MDIEDSESYEEEEEVVEETVVTEHFEPQQYTMGAPMQQPMYGQQPGMMMQGQPQYGQQPMMMQQPYGGQPMMQQPMYA